LFLYNTYEGMPEPSIHDLTHEGRTATAMRQTIGKFEEGWNVATLEEVEKNLASTGYSFERLNFINGLVETTIPQTIPETISILRLDRDFYESTPHEMNYLYPPPESPGDAHR
jgi:O-methyltransferase